MMLVMVSFRSPSDITPLHQILVVVFAMHAGCPFGLLVVGHQVCSHASRKNHLVSTAQLPSGNDNFVKAQRFHFV